MEDGRTREKASQAALKFGLLSLVAGCLVLLGKGIGFLATGSKVVFADALESAINVVAAGFTLFSVRLSARPPDVNHPYGHGKIEYVSAGFEGALILAAAGVIAVDATTSLIRGGPYLHDLGVGFLWVAAASVVNGLVGWRLVREGKRIQSLALVADGQHLLADVLTSGVTFLGLLMVMLTGAEVLDSLAALAAAGLILITGTRLVRRAFGGMMDEQDPADLSLLTDALHSLSEPDLLGHTRLRVRRMGRAWLVDLAILVKPDLTVLEGHALADRVEKTLGRALGEAEVICHVEPAPPEGVQRRPSP